MQVSFVITAANKQISRPIITVNYIGRRNDWQYWKQLHIARAYILAVVGGTGCIKHAVIFPISCNSLS